VYVRLYDSKGSGTSLWNGYPRTFSSEPLFEPGIMITAGNVKCESSEDKDGRRTWNCGDRPDIRIAFDGGSHEYGHRQTDCQKLSELGKLP
jgi:hypothetical protein